MVHGPWTMAHSQTVDYRLMTIDCLGAAMIPTFPLFKDL